jgi:hypothetical protein
MLAATIIRRSLDLPSENDVSVSLTYLSSYGTQIAELELAVGYQRVINECANISNR